MERPHVFMVKIRIPALCKRFVPSIPTILSLSVLRVITRLSKILPEVAQCHPAVDVACIRRSVGSVRVISAQERWVVPGDPDLDRSLRQLQLFPLPNAQPLNVLWQLLLARSVKHLPLPNNVSHRLFEDSWTFDPSSKFGPNGRRSSDTLPEHLVLPHKCQINNFPNVINRFDRVCTVDEDEAVVHCRAEGAAVKVWCDAIEAAEEPIPAFVVVFTTPCRVGASRWEILAGNSTRIADLL